MSSDDSDNDGPPPVRQNTGQFHLSPRHMESGQVSPMAFGNRGQSFRLLASNSFALQRVQSMATLEHSLTFNPLASGVPKDIVRAACSSLRHFISDNGTVSVTDKDIPVNIRQGPRIGSGGYAEVYSGINTITGELVAIKELAVGESSPQQFDDVAAEFNLLRRLRHPNVIRYILFEHSLSQQNCRIVMELMAGGSAQTLLQNYGPLSESVLRGYVSQILAGLDFIHRNEIIHRDIKPANILVHASGVVKLADFGCSKIITARTEATKNLLGTPVYMAPEFIRGHLHQKSDVWAVGCTILELATGRRPWHETNIVEHLPLMFHIASFGRGPEVPSNLSQSLRDFLEQCFIVDPDYRPTAASLLTHQWLVEGEDDEMSQELIEQIGAKQTSALVESLTTEAFLSASTTSNGGERPEDAPQQLLIHCDDDSADGKQPALAATLSAGHLSPTSAKSPKAGAFSRERFVSFAGEEMLSGEHSAVDDGAEVSPKVNAPMHVTFPVAAGGKRLNVELDVQPDDVSVTYVDRRPSYVLNLSDGVRNQLTRAMDQLSTSKRDDGDEGNDLVPVITLGDKTDALLSSESGSLPRSSVGSPAAPPADA